MIVPQWVTVVARLLNVIMDVINVKREKDATDNPADTIANSDDDDGVQSSEETFASISSKSKRNKTS